jgi:hypothetical protein
MAVSGLEQRETPLIIRAPEFSPWGSGRLTPWSYEDEEAEGALNASGMPQAGQKERTRRSNSWGSVATFKQKTRYESLSNNHAGEGAGLASPPRYGEASPRFSRQLTAPAVAGSAVPQASATVPASNISGVCESGAIMGASAAAGESHPPFVDSKTGGKLPVGQVVRKSGADPVELDSVTTLAVRNLPFRMTREEFLEAVNESGFADLYDYVYLPYKFKDNRNLGYVFINFVNVELAREFTAKWHKSPHFKTKSHGKALNVSVARVQGHSANSLFAKSNKMDRVKNTSFRPLMLNGSPDPQSP